MRMTNKPEIYQLNNTAAALDLINQAKAWLIEQHTAAEAAAEAAAEKAAEAERMAKEAARVEEAFKNCSLIDWETLTVVEQAAETLLAAAEAEKAAAEKAAAEAEELQQAVSTATTLPAIDTWAEI